MRKYASLGLFALMISITLNTAFAGNVGDCDFLKNKNLPDYVPGLYGICVAWHNASANGDENALLALEAKWSKKGGTGPIPGSEDDAGTPLDPQWFECPCFVQLHQDYICNLGEPAFDNLALYDSDNPALADVYHGIALFYGESGAPTENFGIAPDLSECSHSISGQTISIEPLNTSDGYVCGFEIGVVAGLTEADFCTP